MSRPAPELAGMTFGRLTVVGRVSSQNNRAMWSCRCSCGKVRYVPSNSLTSGMTRSCGCLRSEASAARMEARRRAAMAGVGRDLTLAAIFERPLDVLDKWRREAR